MNDALKPFIELAASLPSEWEGTKRLHFVRGGLDITVGDVRRLVAGVTPCDPAPFEVIMVNGVSAADIAAEIANLKERTAPLLQDANAELLNQISELQAIINGQDSELQALRREYADISDALATCQGELDGFKHGGP